MLFFLNPVSYHNYRPQKFYQICASLNPSANIVLRVSGNENKEEGTNEKILLWYKKHITAAIFTGLILGIITGLFLANRFEPVLTVTSLKEAFT